MAPAPHLPDPAPGFPPRYGEERSGAEQAAGLPLSAGETRRRELLETGFKPGPRKGPHISVLANARFQNQTPTLLFGGRKSSIRFKGEKSGLLP